MVNNFKVCGIGDSLIKAKSDDLRGWAYHLSVEIAKSLKLRLNYCNFGEGGDTTQDVLKRMNESRVFVDQHWDLVILGVGVNDSRKRGNPPTTFQIPEKTFKKNFRCLLETLCNNKNISHSFIAGILPVIEELTTPFKEDKYYHYKDSIRYLQIQKEVVSEFPNVYFIDFYSIFKDIPRSELLTYMPDGLHPNSEGHRYLANLAYELVIKRFKCYDKNN
jgi:lysophospholipase L1-like esterase